MSKFAITGGRRLKGELCPQGAKNEALQVICACLLTKEEVTLSNVPEILDVLKLIELLPVSYTHLDVYKRQVFNQDTKSRFPFSSNSC